MSRERRLVDPQDQHDLDRASGEGMIDRSREKEPSVPQDELDHIRASGEGMVGKN